MRLALGSYGDLGIRMDNLKSSLGPYCALTLILLIGLFITQNIVGRPRLVLWHQLYSSLLFLIILASAQELFCRGYLMHVLKSVYKDAAVVVILDALFFATAHVIFFTHWQILIPEAFLAGIAFATVYYYYPNVILASLVHSILNLAVIPLCYFALVSC